MASTCPSCNKFPSLEMAEPEIQDEQVDENGHWSVSVRGVRTSGCCGEEMKEMTFEFEGDVDEDVTETHTGDGHELEISTTADIVGASGPTTRTLKSGKTQYINPRYVKQFYGVSIEVEITCSCGQLEGCTASEEQTEQASAWDDLN